MVRLSFSKRTKFSRFLNLLKDGFWLLVSYSFVLINVFRKIQGVFRNANERLTGILEMKG